jgi:hypothetical protein
MNNQLASVIGGIAMVVALAGQTAAEGLPDITPAVDTHAPLSSLLKHPHEN